MVFERDRWRALVTAVMNLRVPLFLCFPGVTTHCGRIFTALFRALASSFSRFLDHTQRHTTFGRTPLDEWSIRRKDLYLTTRQSQQTNIHDPGGIRTHNRSRRAAKDLRLSVATGTGVRSWLVQLIFIPGTVDGWVGWDFSYGGLISTHRLILQLWL